MIKAKTNHNKLCTGLLLKITKIEENIVKTAKISIKKLDIN
jgi:hypothetical protein